MINFSKFWKFETNKPSDQSEKISTSPYLALGIDYPSGRTHLASPALKSRR